MENRRRGLSSLQPPGESPERRKKKRGGNKAWGSLVLDVGGQVSDAVAASSHKLSRTKQQRYSAAASTELDESAEAIETNPDLLSPTVVHTSEGPCKGDVARVDWTRKPDPRLARLFDLHQMAGYVDVPGKSPPHDKRMKDRAVAYYDYSAHFDGGGDDDSRPRMRKFKLCAMTDEHVGWIGGIGYRVYFKFLGSLCKLFTGLALLNSPSLYLNLTDSFYDSRNITDMYDQTIHPSVRSSVRSPAAWWLACLDPHSPAKRRVVGWLCACMFVADRERMSTYELSDDWTQHFPGDTEPWGPRGTLGSIRVSLDNVMEGKVTHLFVRTFLDALSCMIMLSYAAWLGYKLPHIRDEFHANGDTITMGDYCISIRPKVDRKPESKRETKLREKIIAAEQAAIEDAVWDSLDQSGAFLDVICEQSGLERTNSMQEQARLREAALAKVPQATAEEVQEMLELSRERGGWAPADAVLQSSMQVTACSRSLTKVNKQMKDLNKKMGSRKARQSDSELERRIDSHNYQLLKEFKKSLMRKQSAIRSASRKLIRRADKRFNEGVHEEVERLVELGLCGKTDMHLGRSPEPGIWVLVSDDKAANAAKEKIKLMQKLEVELAKATADGWQEFGGPDAKGFPRDTDADNDTDTDTGKKEKKEKKKPTAFLQTEVGKLVRRLQRVDTTAHASEEVAYPVEIIVAVEHVAEKESVMEELVAEEGLLKGKLQGVAIRTDRAKESGTVQHDNLQYSEDEQHKGKLKVWLFTFAMLLLSLALLIILDGLSTSTAYLQHCEEAIHNEGYCDPFTYPNLAQLPNATEYEPPFGSPVEDAAAELAGSATNHRYNIAGEALAAAGHYRESFVAASSTYEGMFTFVSTLNDDTQKGLGTAFPRLLLPDLASIRDDQPLMNASDCRKLCSAEPECDFFTYEAVAEKPGEWLHECYLKKGYQEERCTQQPYIAWFPWKLETLQVESGPVCRDTPSLLLSSDSTTFNSTLNSTTFNSTAEDCATRVGMDYGYNTVGLDGRPCGYAEVLAVYARCNEGQCHTKRLEFDHVGTQKCGLREGNNGEHVSCCRSKQAGETTWNESHQRQCHRTDYKGDVYNSGDRDAICYMCLCNCQHTNFLTDPHCAKPDIEKIEGDYCEDFEEWEEASSAHKQYAAVATIAVNIVVKTVIRATADWERPHSFGVERASVATRIFVAQLCNTAMLLQVLRTDITLFRTVVSMLAMVVPRMGIPETFNSSNYKWYSAIGAPLIFTFFLVSPAV